MPMMPLYQQRTEARGTVGGGAFASNQTAQAEGRLAGVVQDLGQQKALEVREQEERLSQSFASDRITSLDRKSVV